MKDQGNREVDTGMVQISCPVCGSGEWEPVYVRYHETGSFLGRIRIENVICCSCHFMYVNPRPSRKAMSGYYNQAISSSGNTAFSTGTDSRYRKITKERTDFISGVVNDCLDTDIGSVLDVGCSQGYLLHCLDLPHWKLTGLEPCRHAAAMARERGIEVIEGFVESTSLPSGKFDVVLCISTLEHVYDLKSAMENMSGSLEMGGLTFIEVPNSLTPVPQIAEFYSFEHLSHFSPSTLERLLSMHGLEIVGHERNPSLPNLRVAARKVSQTPLSWDEAADDRDSLIEAIHVYRKMRGQIEDDLMGRLEPYVEEWKKRHCRIAVYGAGFHTHFLLNLINFKDHVAYIIDSDERKQGTRFLHWMVHGPEDIETLRPEAIIISSRPFQEEIYRQIAHYQTSLGTKIIKCYD